VKAKFALAMLPLLAALFAFSAPAVGQSTLSVNAPDPGASPARNWFRMRCATCHGQNGEGTKNDWPQTGPALKGNPFIINAPEAAIIRVIRKGRSGKERLYHDTYPNMPSFGIEALPDAEGVVAYLKGELQKQ
jgi:mono/diheme cytochrome c family protein